MAVWGTEDRWKPDYQLIQNGFVSKFYSPEVLAETVSMLSRSGYRVVSVDASRWDVTQDMHRDIAASLNFPDYYGENLDALNDCLSDVASGDYGWSVEDKGLVLVIDNVDKFWATEPRVAFELIDIFNLNATRAALYGNRLMCLVRSDDPRWEPPPFGGYSASWNPTEWLDKNRDV
jgi:hypothetical protein